MMTIFEPLFILCFLATVVVLIVATVTAISGKRARALAALRKLGICAMIYVTVLLVVSAASARKIYRIGDQQCFDDWCITVTGATRPRPESAEVRLRLSSRTKRVPQREKGTLAYLIDSQGGGTILRRNRSPFRSTRCFSRANRWTPRAGLICPGRPRI